jgi:hypothetical protein
MAAADTTNPFGDDDDDDTTVSNWENRDSGISNAGDASVNTSSSSATSLVAPPSVMTNSTTPLLAPISTDPPAGDPAPRFQTTQQQQQQQRAVIKNRRSWIGPVASSSDNSSSSFSSDAGEQPSGWSSYAVAAAAAASSSSDSSHPNSNNPFEEEHKDDDYEYDEEEDRDESNLGIAPLSVYRSHQEPLSPQYGNPFDTDSEAEFEAPMTTKMVGNGDEEMLEAYRHTMMRGALIQGLAPPSSSSPEVIQEKEDEDDEDEEEHYDPRASPFEDEAGKEVLLAPMGGEDNQSLIEGYSYANNTSGGSNTYHSASTQDKEHYYESSRSSSTLSRSTGGPRGNGTSHPGSSRSGTESGDNRSGSATTHSRSSAGQNSTDPPDSDYASHVPNSIWGTNFQTRRTVSIPIHSVPSDGRNDLTTSSAATSSSSVRKRGACCPGRSGRCTLCFLIATTLLLVGAVIVVSLFMVQNNKGPTIDEQINAILLNVSDPTALEDDRTPQAKAREWILFEDTYWDGVRNLESGSVTTQRVVQRYTLAVLYFATNGPTSWGHEIGSSHHSHGWLHGGECDEDPGPWQGLACDSDGEVLAVGFGTWEAWREERFAWVFIHAHCQDLSPSTNQSQNNDREFWPGWAFTD